LNETDNLIDKNDNELKHLLTLFRSKHQRGCLFLIDHLFIL